MRVALLIGGAGYVGGKIQKALLSRGIKCVTLSRETLNYCNFRTLLNLLSELKPDVLINAGGFTGKPNVDQCEKEKSECIKKQPPLAASNWSSLRFPWGSASAYF